MSFSKRDRDRVAHLIQCTFCTKRQLEVSKMVKCTADIYVCIECIDLLHTIVHGYAPSGPPSKPHRPLKERLAEFQERQKNDNH